MAIEKIKIKVHKPRGKMPPPVKIHVNRKKEAELTKCDKQNFADFKLPEMHLKDCSEDRCGNCGYVLPNAFYADYLCKLDPNKPKIVHCDKEPCEHYINGRKW